MDYIAGIFELVGMWLVGNKRIAGFALNIVGGLMWTYIAVTRDIYGLLLMVVPAVFINARNIVKWKGDE